MGKIYHGDCLEIMKNIPDNSIDMVLCDLPYGTTACKWDVVIDFQQLWKQYWRICKRHAPIVLTGSQPFTSALIVSQIKYFKYCWVWDKVNKFTGSLNANKMPMLDYEDIAVFYKKQCIYNKQYREGSYVTRKTTGKRTTDTTRHVNSRIDTGRIVKGLNPKRILSIPSAATTGLIHPTQKPVMLFEYFIKTYTHKGMVILDNCSGSGTTAIACLNTDRDYICIEKDKDYYNKSVVRVENHKKQVDNDVHNEPSRAKAKRFVLHYKKSHIAA